MKAIYLKTAGAIALTAAIAACIPSVDVPLLPPSETIATAPAPAAPAPAPAPTAAPVPVVQEQQYANYLDAPQTPGTWVYSERFDGSVAEFKNAQQTLLAIWCDKDTRMIGIDRASFGHLAQDRMMRISTETTVRDLRSVHVRTATMTAELSPTDPLLDAMAITKGRFAVAMEGERTLYIPAWVEVTRVIEDCR
uniref:hypothetical protein n=1 Tax=uncultured Erythrobacter sp. TaxID=263913 RepID=UPI00260945A6|nr:hypothetical protein [uncultured Erythrobacter sp.]